MMKRLFLAALFAAAFSGDASAQCSGRIAAGTVCGNSGSSSALAAPAPISAMLNNVRSVTSNTTLATSDCGKTIQAGTGSTGLFTLTLPATAGFPASCVISIKNGDSGRGKMLSGFPADFGLGSGILWPLQYGEIRIISGAWATSVNPGLYQAASGVIVSVNHASGSNTLADGLGTGSGAFQTLEYAIVTARTYIRPGGAGILVIQNAAETFSETPSAILGPALYGAGGGSIIYIDGAGSTWTTNGVVVDDFAGISVANFTMKCGGSGLNTLLYAAKFGLIIIGVGMDFNTCAGSAHLQLDQGAQIVSDFGYTVSAIGNFHVINHGGLYTVANKAISIPNALTFSGSWIDFTDQSTNIFSGTTFTGTGAGAGSTGVQYSGSNNSKIYLDATSLVQIPGSTAGTLKTGACLNSTICVPGTVLANSGTAACTVSKRGAVTTITDSNTVVWGANIAGGGGNVVLGYCNGTAWTVAGK